MPSVASLDPDNSDAPTNREAVAR